MAVMEPTVGNHQSTQTLSRFVSLHCPWCPTVIVQEAKHILSQVYLVFLGCTKKLWILPEIFILVNLSKKKVQLRNLSTRWQEVSDTSASDLMIFNFHIFNLEKIFAVLLSCDIYIWTENGC